VELDEFDVADYLSQIRQHGRAQLPLSTRQNLVTLLAATTDAASDGQVAAQDSELLQLAQAVAACETSMLTEPLPSYTVYVNMSVLEHCVGIAGIHGVPDASDATLWRAIDRIIVDLQRQFCSPPTATSQQAAPTRGDRGDRLARLRELVPTEARHAPPPPRWPPPTHLADYAADEHHLALLHLTALPQSTVPEEMLLIRGIHLCELAFWGAYFNVRDALGDLDMAANASGTRVSGLRDAVFRLTKAIEFANVFVPTLHIVRTIDPKVFARFAATAEAAIAIDSRSYQLLESHVYGVLPEKREMLDRMPHARAALEFDRPSFRPLLQYAEHADVGDLIYRLETLVFAWKTYHERRLAADGYLPQPDVGGSTKGPPYLTRQRPPRLQRKRLS
jgi:hypothetical protein